MALCSSTAATDESTPPESPSTTLSSPSFSRSSRTVASTKLSECPLLLAAADACDEILQQLRAVGRMVHFGVELDAPRLLALDVERRDAHVLRAGDDLVVRRNRT